MTSKSMMTSENAVTSQPTSTDHHTVNGENNFSDIPILSQNENAKRNMPYNDNSVSDTECLLCCFEFGRGDNSLINHEGGSVGHHGDCCGVVDCCSCHCGDAGNCSQCDCHEGERDCDCGQRDLNCGHCDMGGCNCGQCDIGGCDCSGCDLGGCTF